MATAGEAVRVEERSGHGRLARNYAVLTAGEFISKLLAFAAFTYLGRVLGPARYGSLEFALAAMVFFTLPVDLGLGDYGARELARNRVAASTLRDQLATLRLLLAAGSFLALQVFAALAHKGPEMRLLLSLYGVSLFGAPVLLQWFFQGHDRMQYVALASIARQAGFAGLVFLFVRGTTPLHALGWIECGSVASAGAVCLAALRRGFGLRPPRPSFDFRALAGHLRQAAPIGLSELAWAFKWYFATVLLGFLAPGPALGWFGASHRVVMALHTFVWLYFFNLLPSISRSAALPRQNLIELMRRSMAVAAWGSVSVALGVTLFASQIMTLAYGAKFAGGGTVLALLIWMVPLSMVSGHYRYTLIGYGRQKLLFYSIAASAALSIALCFVLAPVAGVRGAAVALLAGNAFNLGLSYYFVRRAVVRIPLGLLWNWGGA
jgi:O-antigen/teichoic acid export membrane protein